MSIKGSVHGKMAKGSKYSDKEIAEAIKTILRAQLDIDVDVHLRIVKEAKDVTDAYILSMRRRGLI